MKRWQDSFDAMNPANVPRFVHYSNQRFMPLEPATAKQVEWLRDLLHQSGASEASTSIMFGEGFETLSGLSCWAAHWAIGECQSFLSEQAQAAEAEKRLLYAAARQVWPVKWCPSCEMQVPHGVDGCGRCAS